ncbi:DUF624 domain-containing protein [Streptomyces acidicola]|uniref:DUF624 domain-containing protein n=1 Tax=Streptomyces acidicola TaxID=2596892 RepID=UPI003423928D
MNRPAHRAWWSGRVYEALDTLCRYLLLSLLWTVGTALLVTAPAAAAALVATVRGWAQGDEDPVCSTFLSHVRRSARASSVAAVPLLPAAALLAANLVIVPHMGEQRPYATAALVAVVVPFLVFATNVIPALADETTGVRETYRRTVERIVVQPAAAGITTVVALIAACCVLVQPVSALLIAAPAARLVVAAHGRHTARPVVSA